MLLCVTAGVAISGGCGSKPALTLRTDPEPLARRLHLPSDVEFVRWIAVSPVHDTGWIPPKAEFYDVYAYIQLGPQGWMELQSSPGLTGLRATLALPKDLAARLIPADARSYWEPTSDGLRATGPAFDGARLAADPGTTVEIAIRVEMALLIRMRVE